MRLYWPQSVEFDGALKHLLNNRTFPPFHEEVIAFTQALSKSMIKVRHMPEIVALGYWLRKANIQTIKCIWEKEHHGKIVKARGTVFHIAPSNVDTIFVYSWMLSLLAGNRNIIRISSKVESNALLSIIIDELSRPEFKNIANRTIICTYGHDEKVTEQLSLVCHSRVIWGGDETIQSIRQIPLAPMSNELAFADRFSLAAISSDAIVKVDEKQLNQLLEQFYNDVFWFDQMACSSPRLIIWSGAENVNEEAKERFWSAFEKKIQEKQYELMSATQVLKYTTSLWFASENEVEEIEIKQYFSRVQLKDLPMNVRERHCGAGLFLEYDIESIAQLVDKISDKDQTLAYFGFETGELEELVEQISSRGIDRIVPIGQALNFDGVWDGQNFLKSFTREVVIL